MRPQILFLLLLLIFTIPPSVQAESEINLATGFSFPTGSMSDAATAGPQGGLGVGFKVSPRVLIGAEFYRNWYGNSDETEALVDELLGPEGDADIGVTQYTLSAKVNTSLAASSFYSRFSVGWYKLAVTTSLGDIDVTADETDLGLGLGLGYQFFGDGNVGGFIETMYHSIFSEGDSSNYLDLHAGVSFRFI